MNIQTELTSDEAKTTVISLIGLNEFGSLLLSEVINLFDALDPSDAKCVLESLLTASKKQYRLDISIQLRKLVAHMGKKEFLSLYEKCSNEAKLASSLCIDGDYSINEYAPLLKEWASCSPEDLEKYEKYNLAAFLARDGYKEVEINGEIYCKKYLEPENIVYIDVFEHSGQRTINMMELRSRFQNDVKLYGCFIEKFLDEDAARKLVANRDLIFLNALDENKFRI